ncbi:hypothetical protein SDC9_131903 [bioreactor metagenome]|uniref:Uncharacterized protein n=1 Tax=bioreactor metagenome TaxID=1076179 RepID=A0A645D6L5_9ZZZZ
MVRLTAAKSLVFRSPCRFITDQIWPGTGNTGGAHRFMRIDHDLVFRRFFKCKQVMVIDPLTVMIFTTGNNITYITTFYGRIFILVHQLVRFIKMSFVIADRR